MKYQYPKMGEETGYYWSLKPLTLKVPVVTKINFLLMISMHCQEISHENWQKDHQREKALIYYQILSTNSLWKCMEISLKNLYADTGA